MHDIKSIAIFLSLKDRLDDIHYFGSCGHDSDQILNIIFIALAMLY